MRKQGKKLSHNQQSDIGHKIEYNEEQLEETHE
jgi:hypothetical protein